MIGPVAAIALDPVVDCDEAVGPQRIDAALCVRPDLDESDLAQHPQMPGYGRLSEAGQGGDQFARRALAFGEGVQQGASAWFGDCLEDIHITNIADYLYRHK